MELVLPLVLPLWSNLSTAVYAAKKQSALSYLTLPICKFRAAFPVTDQRQDDERR